MQKIIIAAVSNNGVIGKNGTLPWHIPKDLQQFKEITSNAPMIMGRKTFESLPKILPGRPHIVLSRNQYATHPEAEYASSWQQAFTLCEGYSTQANNTLFIIGGADIFTEGLHYADRIRLTRIHKDVEGDRFFPHFEDNFIEMQRSEFPATNDKEIGFTVFEYRRRN